MRNPFKLLPVLVALASPAFAATEQDAAKSGLTPSAQRASQPYKYKTPKLNRAQFDALLAHPEQLLVIDVRRPDELTKNGGFPAYLSIQSKELEKYLSYIPRDRSIVTVSNHAGRAGAAADLLAEKGFRVVGAVGAQNYEEEGGALTKIAPQTPRTAEAGQSSGG
ncbi:MAG: rhodanese-like domain-containing protein [Methylococcaceae bacterium]|nr:rhodanese-like domain-containing protein [Methylococcaceae bacterium]